MKDFTRLENLIKSFVEKGSVPGCSVAIMQNDELLYHGEAGFMNLEDRTPVTPDSMFGQASMTKLFAYVIMGMLYEEGKFLFQFLTSPSHMHPIRPMASAVVNIGFLNPLLSVMAPHAGPITATITVTMAVT